MKTNLIRIDSKVVLRLNEECAIFDQHKGRIQERNGHIDRKTRIFPTTEAIYLATGLVRSASCNVHAHFLVGNTKMQLLGHFYLSRVLAICKLLRANAWDVCFVLFHSQQDARSP